jgi:hypothetical protein
MPWARRCTGSWTACAARPASGRYQTLIHVWPARTDPCLDEWAYVDKRQSVSLHLRRLRLS